MSWTSRLGPGAAEAGRLTLTPSRLARLEKLAQQSLSKPACSQRMYPDAITKSLSIRGREVRCVGELPDSARPLITELSNLTHLQGL